MTHDTDTLVSEQAALVLELRGYDMELEKWPSAMVHQFPEVRTGLRDAADALEANHDAIGRLTRERDELAAFKTEYVREAEETVRVLSEAADHWMNAENERRGQLNEAEAALSAARAELAECRNKALEEAARYCDMLLGEMPGEGSWGDYDAGLASAYERAADNIRALKEVPHE